MGLGEQHNREHDYSVKNISRGQIVTPQKPRLLRLGDCLWHFFTEEHIFSCAKLVIRWMLEEDLG